VTGLLPTALAALAAAVAAGLPAPSRLGALHADLNRRRLRAGHPAPGSPRRTAARAASEGSDRDSGTAWRAVRWLVPVALVVFAAGPAAGALGVLAGVLAARFRGRRALRRAREAERAGAAEALAVLAAELSAGRPAAYALEAAASVALGPFSSALASAAGSGQVGADPGSCLLHGAAASAVPEVLRSLAACWQVCSATGSSLAAAVGRLAEGLRAEHAQRLAVENELAGPRATAGLLAGLPVAGIALAAGLGAQPVHVLLDTPLGVGCLAIGIGLELLGVWWTGRLVAAAGGTR
jgi:tight adherence protein B